MHKMAAIIVLVLCLTVGGPYVSGANILQAPDNTDNEHFTYANAMTGMQNINSWLKSFQALTNLTADRITSEEKQQVGNLGADMQTLGFYNWVQSVEGTLHKQNYQIRKLEYELAREQLAAGKARQAEVDEKERKYHQAGMELQRFLVRFHIAD